MTPDDLAGLLANAKSGDFVDRLQLQQALEEAADVLVAAWRLAEEDMKLDAATAYPPYIAARNAYRAAVEKAKEER